MEQQLHSFRKAHLCTDFTASKCLEIILNNPLNGLLKSHNSHRGLILETWQAGFVIQ